MYTAAAATWEGGGREKGRKGEKGRDRETESDPASDKVKSRDYGIKVVL